MKKTVLILDDEVNLALSLAREFEDHGWAPVVAAGLGEIPSTAFDYAVIDLRLKGEFGLEAFEILRRSSSACRIVVLTGYGSIATAMEAVRRGAVDYLTKPASFAKIQTALQGLHENPSPEFKTLSLAEVEHEHIDFVLTKNNGNISKTARELGLHRQSLQRKLKKYT